MSSPLSHQLFHGTIETLKPGAVIKPLEEGKNVWATKSFDYAQKHTTDRISSGLGFSSTGQHPHHGNIYEVEPLPADAVQSDNPELLGDKNTVVSKKGFVVKGQVASVLNPDLGARKHRDPITNKPRPFK
jgi:hypothetical protein